MSEARLQRAAAGGRAPYRTTPVFDQDSLPAALRREHRTRHGVWGIIRVLEGRLRLDFCDGGEGRLLDPATPGLIGPEQPHLVRPLGPVRMQVEFFDAEPAIEGEVR